MAYCRRLLAFVAALFALELAIPSIAAACLHDATRQVDLDIDADGTKEQVCVYLLNLWASDVRRFQGPLKEQSLVTWITGEGTTRIAHPRARFLQPGPSHTWDERMSVEGAIMLRAYENGNAIPVKVLGKAALRVAIDGKPAGEFALAAGDAFSQVVYVESLTEQPSLGQVIQVTLQLNGAEGSREAITGYSWFRPSDGLALDYSLVSFGVPIRDRCRSGCSLTLLPATLRLQYRYYFKRGEAYLFPGVLIGPNIALPEDAPEDAKSNEEEAKSKVRVNGVVGGLSLNINGFEIGGGGLLTWDPPKTRVTPIIVFSISEAVWHSLGYGGKFPGAITQTGD